MRRNGKGRLQSCIVGSPLGWQEVIATAVVNCSPFVCLFVRLFVYCYWWLRRCGPRCARFRQRCGRFPLTNACATTTVHTRCPHSCLVDRYLNGEFNAKSTATIGAAFRCGSLSCCARPVGIFWLALASAHALAGQCSGAVYRNSPPIANHGIRCCT